MRRVFLVAAVGALLAACAAYGPAGVRVGATEAEVTAAMGAPSARYAMPGGISRLAYARGPFGRHTWMIDLDAGGRVASVTQALGESQFAALPAGIDAAELLRRIGPPAERRPRGLLPGQTWSYRYPTNDCLWYQVTIDGDGKFLGGGYGIDPACDPPSDRALLMPGKR
jgi:hypothetical protein